jgi:hypothetical protein
MTRRIETFRCAACGRSGARRSPDQRFCTDRCRAYTEAKESLSAEGGYQRNPTPPPTHQRPFKSIPHKNGPKFSNEINGQKSDFFDVPLANWHVVAGGTIGSNPWQSIIDASARKRARRAGVYAGAPLNLLGGYRWPDAPKLDAKTAEIICRCEIGEVVR